MTLQLSENFKGRGIIVKKNEAQVITELLEELFKTEGFKYEVYENWIIPEGTEYAIKGYWYSNATDGAGQLTVEVFLNSERLIVESFAGLGDSNESRLQSAFSSFLHHTFPTLLTAIWGRESDKIHSEIWTISDCTYQVYLGKQGIINYDNSKLLTIPSSYELRIKEIVLDEELTEEFHWFTLFYANLNGLDNYAEMLNDNQKSVTGAKRLKKMNWQRSNHYYAVRQFLVLKKIEA